MATKNNQSGSINSSVETIVRMNEQGRITIPLEVRSLLELRNSKVVITVIYGGKEVGTVINVDESGRATIPKQTRRYLGIDGDEQELRLIIERR